MKRTFLLALLCIALIFCCGEGAGNL